MPRKTTRHRTELATIHALRGDLALQIARFVARSGLSQTVAARTLGVPQPTLSKIANAQVSDLSMELLIRIAVRAGLLLSMQIGNDASEAGVFLSRAALPKRATTSRLADQARLELDESTRSLTPEQRLEAQLRHSELLVELQRSGMHSRPKS